MTRITLRDVAERAGVSYQTVSNIINNTKSVKPETRERVERVIREMGFVPNFTAKVLRQQKSMTLGCVFYEVADFDVEDPYRNMVQSAVSKASKEANYSLLTYHVFEDNPNDLEELKVHLSQGRLDGLLFLSPSIPDTLIHELSHWNRPIVLFDRFEASSSLPSVMPQYGDGIRQLVHHLVQKGRKCLAFVGGRREDYTQSGELRLSGFLEATRELGVCLSSDYICHGDWSFEGGKQVFETLWNLNPRPDAILSANDRMAIGLLSAAFEMGVRVPEDVSITGFDDIEFSRYTNPPLTTVHVPYVEMVNHAVQTLVDMIDGQDIHDHLWMPVSLRIRSSS
ncbi:LacI family DNA-binding transcriptional regulator [Deinococcus cellulosilyticus]|uniref:Alanine racemase n=1 Tax=Deinococcus cellulosilyticus (strain DSM 18568 / NBRC 106333 / KACC 11606 / 5516J-15) TaxID=1223518 RepID=A0A511N125_DEIC1|nr:LacI family DNA-binding transcriptional regulator [Deinococcus cellulosilyticus]GEM46171.1 alanine racemase [Deinococcus cellulosilyticus NBRC 106333 = KACC 11606]